MVAVVGEKWSAFWQRTTGALGDVQRVARLLRRDPLALAGLVIVAGFVAVALLAPLIVPYPEEGRGISNLTRILRPPSFAHPFGTDEFGRDLLSRVFFGASLALQVGVSVVLMAFAVGAPLGVIAGYYRGAVEEAIMRVTDMFLAFPPILLALVIAAALGRGSGAVVVAIAISFWPWYTRLVHGQVLHVRSQPFVDAAVALGLPRRRIVFRHVFPNALAPATIQASMDVGSAILSAAALNFLGLGPQPPTPDWGVMVNTAYLAGNFSTFWWYATFPGLAIFLVVLAFNLVGDGAREVLDPKLRRRRLL